MSQVPSPAPYFAKLITPLTLEHQQWALMPPSYLDYITMHFAKKREKKEKETLKIRQKGKTVWAFASKIPSF